MCSVTGGDGQLVRNGHHGGVAALALPPGEHGSALSHRGPRDLDTQSFQDDAPDVHFAQLPGNQPIPARQHCASGEPIGQRGTVKYLNSAALDVRTFCEPLPYPWVAPAALLSEEGFRKLATTLPVLARFERVFGKQRRHGQKPRDRYALEWEPGMEPPEPQRKFIEDLRGETYCGVLSWMLSAAVRLRFLCLYTPRGCLWMTPGAGDVDHAR